MLDCRNTRRPQLGGTVQRCSSSRLHDDYVGGDVVYVDWDKAGLESSDVNLLLLSDRLRDCHFNHLRLRKHLYLDRNQTIGESELRRSSAYLVFLDYMMKLRAKM